MAWWAAALKAVGTAVVASKTQEAVAKKPGVQILKPTAPTIDDAAQNQGEIDQIKRRKGVLSNIFAGGASSAATPTVGTKTLLGQ